ncbi:MAG TPA: UTP--glucose-1-phosphate uridylyltransferase [Myxococcota bacterium]|jgi:UTP--glucose-1-phosphate uridylyltransferase|nr:UTP--glucose-1-phosphate uridylyltransferase [Myxococcota bacterium]
MGSEIEARFRPFEAKMREAGVPALAIDGFRDAYAQVCGGATGLVPESDLEPVEDLPRLDALGAEARAGEAVLDRAVLVKLNGGLGTSMGMSRAKSLLPVRPGRSFLDVLALQVLALRRAHGARLPLVLMDSFRTRDDSLAALRRHPGLETDVPLDFLQHKVPRILASDLSPVVWPRDPSLEWCPPGHGDLYLALATSGVLERLRRAGYRYAFVSNADNLGATLDLALLGWFASEGAPFAMEVADRTAADRKGGHLARRRGGGPLVLRESAQCPPADSAAFQDIARHRFFNTNNLWLDLDALARLLQERGGALGLPLIRNEKRIDPDDPTSPKCLQLETAMGAAIALFPDARAVRVPRARFAPVKTTNDLLVLWSDAYALGDDGRLAAAPGFAPGSLFVDLDARHFGHIEAFQARFSHGAPSLVACRRFVVKGDVRFGRGVVARGEVAIEAPEGAALEIADGARLGSG